LLKSSTDGFGIKPKKLSQNEIESVDRLVDLLELFQNPHRYIPNVTQSDLHKMFLKATGSKTLQHEYSFSSLLDLDQLKKVLKTNGFIQDNRFIYLDSFVSGGHVLCLFKYGKIYYFYDSNDSDGERITESTDDLAEWIFKAHPKLKNTQPSGWRFRMFAFPEGKNFVAASYPKQEAILEAIKSSYCTIENSESGLSAALSNGDLGSIRYFLKPKSTKEQKELIRREISLATPFVYYEDNWTILTYAVYSGYADIVKEFLEILGDDFNSVAFGNHIDLMTAAKNGYCDFVKIFLDKGGDSGVALISAAEGGQLDIIKMLFEQKLIKPDKDIIKAALEVAVKHNHVEVVKILFNAAPRAKDVLDMIFMYAVKYNHLNLIEWCIDSGADPVNIALLDNRTALMMAAESGHIQVVKKLLACKQVIDNREYLNTILPSTHDNALMLALKQKHTHIVKEFITAKQAGLKIDFNQVSTDGYTALMLALQQNDDGSVNEMLKIKDIKLDQVSSGGDTVLVLAAKEENIDMVLTLLSMGLKVNPGSPESYMAALMLAIQNGRLDVVTMLIEQRIDLNRSLPISETESMSILELAVINNYFDIVKKLLEHGANPNIITQDDSTILAIAVENGYCEIVELLINNTNIKLDRSNVQRMIKIAKEAKKESTYNDKAYNKIIELLKKFSND